MAKAARYCAIVVGVLQLLLALLSLWVLVDLNVVGGAQISLPAYVCSGGFVVAQICILALAWRLSFHSPRRMWLLVTLYSAGLAFLSIVLGIFDLFNRSVNLKSLFLEPGAVLPPNEIMGPDWPLAVAVMSAGAAIVLGILPLASICAVLLRASRGTLPGY